MRRKSMNFCGRFMRVWIDLDNRIIEMERSQAESWYDMFPGTPQHILEERLQDWLKDCLYPYAAKEVKIVPNK